MSQSGEFDELDLVRRLRPDRVEPADPGDPAVYSQHKERLMSTIESEREDTTVLATPDVYPRLAYRDERAAVEYLTRVFQLVENREARMESGPNDHILAWLQIGTGVVMVGHANTDVHLIHSPQDAGLTTVMLNVYVPDVDAHYEHAQREGADITVELRDAFWGERTYEARDLEGHQWHFAERFADIRARHGREPEPPPEDPC